MNRVLFKAAAIVNIAAAALIYVACSGDDGKDGAPGAGCIAQVNTVAGGHDIVCGGVVYGNIKDGVQGPPGTATTGACTGTAVANGIAITCNGEFVGIVTNGEPGPAGPPGQGGGDPSGVCDMQPYKVNDLDNGIQLKCGSDIARIITCEKQSGFDTGIEFCNMDGYIGQGSALICGGKTYNPRTQFCQRVTSTGDFSGGAFAADTATAYQRSETSTSVTSVAKYLCGDTTGIGTYITQNGGQITINFSGLNGFINGGDKRVYDANSTCARNLVIDTLAQDNNVSSSFTTNWGIVNDNNCFIYSAKHGNYISPKFEAECDFKFGATLTPYTSCPEDKPVVSIDNRRCVARADCLYHSAIDNTCYETVGDWMSGSTTITNPGYTITNTEFYINTSVIKGIDLIQNPSPNTNKKANKWSRTCETKSGSYWFVANDPKLTYLCAGDVTEDTKDKNPKDPTDAVDILKVAIQSFDDAFTCESGYTLTTNVSANNGSAWNRPLYCRLDVANASFTSPVTEDQCTYGLNGVWTSSESSKKCILNATTEGTCSSLTSGKGTWTSGGACNVTITTIIASSITELACETTIPGTAALLTASGLTGAAATGTWEEDTPTSSINTCTIVITGTATATNQTTCTTAGNTAATNAAAHTSLTGFGTPTTTSVYATGKCAI